MSNPLFPRVPRLEEQPIPVSELNRRAKSLLENSFPPLWVSGEISNLTKHGSGHWYFSLKDDKAQVRCVMFRHRNQYLDFSPKDGMQVEARVVVSLYEARGEFQLNIENMRPGGLGALFEAFGKLKAKLDAEGLFAAEHKKPLPSFPGQIGVITSLQAAALRDVLSTLKRRMPTIPIVLYPTPVQGRGACLNISQAIKSATQRAECDVLILCRGGGSIEDLWEFNEEIVARAIYACPIPIVCGVGHETDFTIADFVADQRAPTPTAAAELVSPNRAELIPKIDSLAQRTERIWVRQIEARMQHLDHLQKRLVHPGERLRHQQTQLTLLSQRSHRALQHHLDTQRWRLRELSDRMRQAQPNTARLVERRAYLAARLSRAIHNRQLLAQGAIAHLAENLVHLNPQAILERGYNIARDESGKVVRDSHELQAGKEVALTFAIGGAKTKVISTSE